MNTPEQAPYLLELHYDGTVTLSNPPMSYQEKALRTNADTYHRGRYTNADLLRLLEIIKNTGAVADAAKAALFYGTEDHSREGLAPPKDLPQDMANLLHALLGKADELGEMAEAFFDYYLTDEIDRANFVEELGDDEWFSALAREALGVTQPQTQQANLDKLRERYPEAFNKKRAATRDRASERRAIEENLSEEPAPYDVPEGSD